jgi:hypothetical protein
MICAFFHRYQKKALKRRMKKRISSASPTLSLDITDPVSVFFHAVPVDFTVPIVLW